MADASNGLAPIIIIKKKKKVSGDGHHGGAWKVAYADFVTAMMAFFLLMWLLNATTEEQRKGIADYFNPTIPISRISGGGSDGLNGSSIFTEQTYAKMGTGATASSTLAKTKPLTQDEAAEFSESSPAPLTEEEQAAAVAQLEMMLSGESEALSEHIQVKLSPEGIVMELVDSDDVPLFALGESNPTGLLVELVAKVTESFGAFGNNIKVVGHTDSLAFRDDFKFDNWDLSTERANVARRMLVEEGFPLERIQEVSGRADTDLLVPDDPYAAQNRRISITLLKQEVAS
ncbi:MAG: OmpA family protein [Hyphomonas sp.]|jgi:chemotaxis protein MotB|nr:OmpA family protein [Henriciella sp.]MCH9752529.1 OmpA family protein [Alphaproteobacteria bacterium]MCR9225087.1 OmpA family protein [Hyphomonas sp.]